MRTNTKTQYHWLWLTFIVVTIDQYSKYLAMLHLKLYEKISILPIFNIYLISNHGAAWGFLKSAGGWQIWLFSSVAIVLTFLMLAWIYRQPFKNHLQTSAICLIIGGAIGNLVDRIHLGFVIDFIQLHYHSLYFAVFNIADTAITFGSIFLIFSLRKQNKDKANIIPVGCTPLFRGRR